MIQSTSGGGKSTELRRIACNAVRDKKELLFITLEEQADEVLIRTACQMTGVMYKDNNNYTPEERNILEPQLKEVFKYVQVWHISGGKGLEDNIMALINKAVIDCGCKFIVLDYLGCLDSTNSDITTAQYLGDIADYLQNIAYDYTVCIVTAMQMNRLALGALKQKKDFDVHNINDEYIQKSHAVAEKCTVGMSIFTYNTRRYINIWKNRTYGKLDAYVYDIIPQDYTYGYTNFHKVEEDEEISQLLDKEPCNIKRK